MQPPPSPTQAAIALGSNLGDRAAHLRFALEALRALPSSTLLASSAYFETPPLTDSARPAFQPGGPYLNAAALLSTALPTRDLLSHLLRIEALRGRDRSVTTRWAPRTLDLDLLLYGDSIISEPGLTIPHPGLASRAFVLVPLASIAPDLPIPPTNTTPRHLLAALPPSDFAAICPS
ncbi:MAG: 2-amino-4-hydroxy-6-hydroxymethyldihydropteridine diphosphokinase [Phycisphaerales bacterium]|nr:2-amino-4-hydroxy-6-hydroxymethyldihydropteridine diphosphokinase [Phycisphaerales bacterium]